MASFIIIRLHSVVPVNGMDFQAYLDGLTITAFDLRTEGDPPEALIGTAEYLAPPPPAPGPFPPPIGTPNPNTGIVQHFADLASIVHESPSAC